MSRICCTSAASTSATRRFGSGGTGSARCSPLRSGSAGSRGCDPSRWRWHLDEMFVKINGERHYLWRAVDHEGEVLESFVTKTRDKKAALKFLRKAMKRHGRPDVFVTDKLRSYGAALKEIGAAAPAGNRPLAEQQGGEFAPAIPTTRAGDAPVPADAKSAEIRRRPRLRLQPLQSGTQPLKPNDISSSTVPPLSPSGAVLARHKGQHHCPCRDWFELV